MIIMINGPFGVGKTSAAKLLDTVFPDSMIYDPEEIGYTLREIVVRTNQLEAMGDYQHLPLWPYFTVEFARQLYHQYQRHLIVPMTMAFPDYFQYIKAGFSSFESKVHHFCLLASPETIRQRLAQRGEAPGGWPEQQLERCLAAFAHPQYEVYIDTERLDTPAVVDFILSQTQQQQ